MKTRILLETCRRRKLLIATAESCTGGLVASELTRIPGSSDVFDRGFITYSNKAKRELLSVLEDSLERFGAVSKEVAAEMAFGACKYSDADLSVSVTGIAGPGGTESKPEGRVCFAVARKGALIHCACVDFGSIGRDSIRNASVKHAISLLLAAEEAVPD